MDEAGVWEAVFDGVNVRTTTVTGVTASQGSGMDAAGVVRAVFDSVNSALRVIAVA